MKVKLWNFFIVGLLVLLYLFGCLLPTASTFYALTKPLSYLGHPAPWTFPAMVLATFGVVSWQFLEQTLKQDKSQMFLSLLSVGGVAWTSDGMSLVLMNGIESLSDLHLGWGTSAFSATGTAIQKMSVQFPLGALALLANKILSKERTDLDKPAQSLFP